jgi:hypothetical protein
LVKFVAASKRFGALKRWMTGRCATSGASATEEGCAERLSSGRPKRALFGPYLFSMPFEGRGDFGMVPDKVMFDDPLSSLV